MKNNLLERLQVGINKMGDIDISGSRFDDPTPEMLLLDQLTLDVHTIMQAPAMAYYGMMLAGAEKELKSEKDAFDRWLKVKMLEAGAKLMGSDEKDARYKPSAADKEARVLVDCEQSAKEGKPNEYMRRVERISELEDFRNVVKFWYDGFQTKNFHMGHYANRDSDERGAIQTIKAPRVKTPIESPSSSFSGSSIKKAFIREG
jgi:hypothetical protein